MTEYKLIVNEDGAKIFDQQGSVSTDIALLLIDQLKRTYEQSACVYIMQNKSMCEYKIGWTSQKIESRTSQVRYAVGDWQEIELELTIPCLSSSEARRMEKELHTRFSDKNLHGEWFDLSANDLESLQELRISRLELYQPSSPWRALSNLDTLARQDPATCQPEDKATILESIAQVRVWLDAFEKKWKPYSK